MTTTTLGFIGLGDLGAPVAANLLDAGYAVRVYNRTASKAQPLVTKGAVLAERPQDAIEPGGIVISLLWDDASVLKVMGVEDVLQRLGDGLHISMTTMTPEGSVALAARHAAHGSTLVEAPIFGRPDAAVAKQLWIPSAGPAEAKARVRPILEACGARGVFDFGEQVGAATAVKLVGNFMIISMASAMAEGLALVSRHGFDPAPVVDMLTSTLFDAPIFHGYRRAFTASAPPPPNAIPVKDLGLFHQSAAAVGAPSPICDAMLKLREA
jgi:3-hydroxyisobutyrate dehydrogenase-like beta-hydroxyacid dehydrogenase